MNYLLAAKLRYYAENNSNNILKKVNSSISRSITTCRPELLCILDDMVSIEPCSYWNKDVFETTEKNLQNIVQKGNSIFINEEIFELFLAGYHAYMQITNVINDLSGVNDSPAMKNRQYRIPTYVSIVEGCLTNLYHFITLLINQTSEKDYASTYKLKPLCGILVKTGFDALTDAVNINIRNAINHGGIIFKEDGQVIDFHYTEGRRSVSCSLNVHAPYSENQVYMTFRRILWNAGISHGGTGKGPRIHDFRHSFAVKSLRKMIYNNDDIMAVMPLLSQYLGHKNIYATQNYLQFTADMFPYVTETIQNVLGDVVPGMEVYDEETY